MGPCAGTNNKPDHFCPTTSDSGRAKGSPVQDEAREQG